MPTFNDIIDCAKEYLPEESLSILEKAYEFAVERYVGIPDRLSGGQYITHPLAVCNTLVEMRLDIDTLVAGILHRMLRDNQPIATIEELTELFGADVAMIINGATKINEIQFNSHIDYKAKNVKKMLIAISNDIRVLLVKLADHLHDMRTARFLRPEVQREMAQDTLDLYAPLASRLGIDWIKREFEDLAFNFLHPLEFEELSSKIEMSLKERGRFVEDIKSILRHELQKEGLVNFRILGRPKHLYSIYRKLVSQNIPVEKVYDKVAFRIILQAERECYEAVGIVHSLWKPVASRFKDFISAPKANLYQSLHSSVVGPHGDFMEIQIRTEAMDEVANDGIAAHWAYKEGASISIKEAQMFHWLKQLVQGLQEMEDPKDFLDAVKDELDHTEVYALTPKGDVKELPAGSTPLDFAYAIHTEVGHQCVGAKIEGKIVPLKYEIKNGDVIEILTAQTQHPSRRWLAQVKTSRAKSRIRNWLKLEQQAKDLALGREICERELRKNNLNLKKIIKTGHFKTILRSLSCNSLDELMRKVGSKKVLVSVIVDELQPVEIKKGKNREEEDDSRLKSLSLANKSQKKRKCVSLFQIDGMDNIMANASNCCMPMPGDPIMGFITTGRGVTVHKITCPNFVATDSRRHINVEWSVSTVQGQGGCYKVRIQIVTLDRKGMFVSVCDVIAREDADIIDLEAHSLKNYGHAKMELTVTVRDREHLTSLLSRIGMLDGVLQANRR